MTIAAPSAVSPATRTNYTHLSQFYGYAAFGAAATNSESFLRRLIFRCLHKYLDST